MNTEHFKLYLEHIKQVKNFPTSEIESLIEAYPFCSNLYFLLAKKYKDEQDDANFARSIQRLAPIAPDRNYLMKIFENDEFFNQYQAEGLALGNIHEPQALDMKQPLAALTPLSTLTNLHASKKSEELMDLTVPSVVTFSHADKIEFENGKVDLEITENPPTEMAIEPLQPIEEDEVLPTLVDEKEDVEEEVYDSIDDILDDTIDSDGEPVSEIEENIPQPDDEPIVGMNNIEISPQINIAEISLSNEALTAEGCTTQEAEEEDEEIFSLYDEDEDEKDKEVNLSDVEIQGKQPLSDFVVHEDKEIYNELEEEDDEDENSDEDENNMEIGEQGNENSVQLDIPMPMPKESFSSWLKQLESPEKSIEKMGGKFQIPKVAQDEEYKLKFQEKLREKEQKKKKEQELLEFAEESLKANEDVISETLAHLLASQGHIDRAIKMYEKLKLTFPEKSAYFAELISKLKIS